MPLTQRRVATMRIKKLVRLGVNTERGSVATMRIKNLVYLSGGFIFCTSVCRVFCLV